MAKLSETEIQEHLQQVTGWQQNGDMIQKTYKLPSFPAAVAFVTHIGFLAEAAVHHPDIDIRYNKVIIGLSTHDVGGISEKDFALAADIDEIMM
jgi:4a-hydroxytetrahydrobiopterin dehydratase